ncbi:MAG: tRNA preQ1(34) S-adenosylmethionine ribosyltransferase-isomerase QueA [Treponema sp.]|nr:tRNA preQ1(34) S-adenosylmethionine ribosyltransferase-isomerase QueA [Treponema sp.]
MKTSDFSFDLPDNLIAQYPPEQRGNSRLMVLDRKTGIRSHRMVHELPEILCGDAFRSHPRAARHPEVTRLPLLVFNNSKVRKARLIGTSVKTGTRVEFLLLEGIGDQWKVLVQRAKRRKPGSRYVFHDTNDNEIAQAEIVSPRSPIPDPRSPVTHSLLQFDRLIDDDWLDRYGHIPLPPYIKRQDAPEDADRYQTVYASAYGSSAAPTAGLHFTNELLERIAAAGIETAFITLHVGLGTFLPVRTENITDHVMHEETFSIDENTAEKIETAKAEGRKVIAVGTTSIRTLESAWFDGKLKTGEGRTALYIYPGYRFKAADALFTNFHTPESTLLMLVAAFAGREYILESYTEAIRENYRFFSYGDAMLIA